MMRVLMLLGVTYVAVVLQTTVCPSLRLAGATADLVVLEALAVVVLSSSPYSFLWAGWLGLLHDVCSAGRIGPCMFWLALVGYVLARLRQQLFMERAAAQAVLVLLGTGVVLGALSASRMALGEASGAWGDVAGAVCGSAAYTAVLGWVVLGVLGRFSKADSAWAG